MIHYERDLLARDYLWLKDQGMLKSSDQTTHGVVIVIQKRGEAILGVAECPDSVKTDVVVALWAKRNGVDPNTLRGSYSPVITYDALSK